MEKVHRSVYNKVSDEQKQAGVRIENTNVRKWRISCCNFSDFVIG